MKNSPLLAFIITALLLSLNTVAAASTGETQVDSLASALNQSGDMTLLGGNYIIRYHSSATNSDQTLSLLTRQLKYKAENAPMFRGPIPEAVPYLRAKIDLCDISALTAQLPGAGAFGKTGSDRVLAVELRGDFSDYDAVDDNKAEAYSGDATTFTFYIRAKELLNVSQQLQLQQVQYCGSKKSATITITSLYHSGEISREQAEKLIQQ